MSKSKGNVINPDDIVNRFGADTLRLYEMFMGPFDQAIAWSEDSLVGPRRFIEKVWRLREKVDPEGSDSGDALLHQTIKKVSEDIEEMGFNTAVSAMMVLTNTLDKKNQISRLEFESLLKLLAPFAPHVAEELWSSLGNTTSIHKENWPQFDESKLEKDEYTLAVQVNGKMRATLTVSKGESEEVVKKMALELPEVAKWLGEDEPKKVIVVPGKIVSIVL